MKKLVALALITLSTGAAAQINKCVDKSGKTVGYGTACPSGTLAQPSGVKSSPAPAAGAPSATAPKSIAERDADFRKRQVEQQEAAAKSEKKSAQAEQRKRACTDAQSYLKSLQGGHRITRTDPKTGERVFLGDAEYSQEIARTQKNIQTNCS